MEFFKTRINYSYIGEYIDFLIQNEQRIKNLMIDYEIQSKVDALPDGREVKSFIFTKENVSIRFLPIRLVLKLQKHSIIYFQKFSLMF